MSGVDGERHPTGDAWGRPIPEGTVQPAGGGKGSGGGLCGVVVMTFASAAVWGFTVGMAHALGVLS